MRPQNQTLTGNICSQNVARAWLLLGDRLAFSVFPHRVGEDTEPLDFHFENIAGLHVDGWLTRRSHTTWCAGDNHVASLQAHRDTDHCNQRRDAEDELVRARILHYATI